MANRAAYWQRMVAEWEVSGLSQAEFCRRRELKAVTFGGWKQRLVGSLAQSVGRGRRNHASQEVGAASNKPGVNGQAPSFVEVGKQGTDNRTSSFVKVGKQGAGRSKPSFVEVALAGEMAVGRSSKVSDPGGARESGYAVVLPCGTSIRLPADFEVDKVSQLIQVARSC